MLTLFGNLDSGNVHKVQMILALQGLDFCRVDVAQPRGEPRDPRFLAINPMGKVPAVLLEDGTMMSESGALLFYFGADSNLWPKDHRGQTEVLRWMFFEQYSHEPALAVARYMKRFAEPGPATQARLEELLPKCEHVLGVMEQRLGQQPWLAAPSLTIADLALYPYSALSEEVGLSLASYPALSAWIARLEATPGLPKVYQDRATEVLTFSEYF